MLVSRQMLRMSIPAALAVMLTFDRFGFLPFEGLYTNFDQAINYFVAIFTPAVVAFTFRASFSRRYLWHATVFLILAGYICAHLLFTVNALQPHATGLISLALAVLFALNLDDKDLPRLRRAIVFLSIAFNVVAFAYSDDIFHYILVTANSERLGVDISSANVVILPRILYVTVLACLASAVIERHLLYRVCSLAAIPIPLMVAIATGGRGPLVSFCVATVVLFLLSNNHTFRSLLRALILSAVVLLALSAIISNYFPFMQERIMSVAEGNERVDVWIEYLQSPISLFGHGITKDYPHNIFFEMLYDYGLLGLVLFLTLLFSSLKFAYIWSRQAGEEKEGSLLLAIIFLELGAQQFSLNIYYAALWAALLIPLNVAKRRLPGTVTHSCYAKIEG